MSVMADTNWLEALYFVPDPNDPISRSRAEVVARRMRRQSGPLTMTAVVFLECRNVFGRLSKAADPKEWQDLLEDIGRRLALAPMDWDLLSHRTHGLFRKFSHKIKLGTFDTTLLASAQLAGATEILSFDDQLKGVAAALGMKVFPPLGAAGRRTLSAIRR